MMTAIALSQEQSEDYSIREWDAKGLGLQNQQRRPQYIYLEENVPDYDLPNPLVFLNGKKVRNTRAWTKKRRPEILELFETHVYGKSPGRGKNARWLLADSKRGAIL